MARVACGGGCRNLTGRRKACLLLIVLFVLANILLSLGMGLNHLLPTRWGHQTKKNTGDSSTSSNQHGIMHNHDHQHQHQHHFTGSGQQHPGYRNVMYFCNWAIYGRKHVPQSMPVEDLTHILYAFAKPDAESGEAKLSDPWADTDIKIWDDAGPTGCLGALEVLRQRNPNLKLLLSIGGWTYSSDLATAVATPDKRRAFVTSSVEILRKHRLDGIDIDWEYPQNATQSQLYVDLLRDFRLELDSEALRESLPRHQFELSIACPAGPEQMAKLRIADMDPYLDFWNIMAYDFAGSWSNTTDFHSNLYGGDISANGAVRYYLSRGVPAHKLVLGMPVYGRAFVGTDGLGRPYSSIGEGSWERGVWDYKDLPLKDANETVDRDRVSAYCYNPHTKTLVVYDNPETVQYKAQYIAENGLGGGMWWESSADVPVNQSRSLIAAFAGAIGRDRLEQRPNCLNVRRE